MCRRTCMCVNLVFVPRPPPPPVKRQTHQLCGPNPPPPPIQSPDVVLEGDKTPSSLACSPASQAVNFSSAVFVTLFLYRGLTSPRRRQYDRWSISSTPWWGQPSALAWASRVKFDGRDNIPMYYSFFFVLTRLPARDAQQRWKRAQLDRET